jgi:hypothetical protein
MLTEQAGPLDPTAFVNRTIDIFGGPPHWEDLDSGLKQMAFTFLWPPSPELMRAAKADFVAVMRLPPTVIAEYLFGTTTYYFKHKEELPGCAHLVTFRGEANADKILALPAQHRYFQWWRAISYRTAFGVWLVMLVVFALIARQKHLPASRTTALAIAFVALGFVQVGVTFILHDYEPRFSLPLWQLLLLSLFLLAGQSVDLLTKNEKSAGQLVGPEP